MHKKIFIILIVMGILFSSFAGKIHAFNIDGSFYFSPASGNFYQTCQSSAAIMINSGSNASNAANIIIDYNPNEIDILDADPSQPGIQLQPGTAYESYADNIADSSTGRIKLTGFSISKNLTGSATFGTILFASKPGVTSTSFTIEFSGQGNTLDSNIAETVTSNDILSSATNVSYNFEPIQSCSIAYDSTAPTITFSSPKDLDFKVVQGSKINATICDSEAGVNIDSVNVDVNGKKYTKSDSAFSYKDQGNGCFDIVVDPGILLTNEAIKVTINAADTKANNGSADIIYSIPSSVTNNCQTGNATGTGNVNTNQDDTKGGKCTNVIVSETEDSRIAGTGITHIELLFIVLFILIMYLYIKHFGTELTSASKAVLAIIYLIGFLASVVVYLYFKTILDFIAIGVYIIVVLPTVKDIIRSLVIKNPPNLS